MDHMQKIVLIMSSQASAKIRCADNRAELFVYSMYIYVYLLDNTYFNPLFYHHECDQTAKYSIKPWYYIKRLT